MEITLKKKPKNPILIEGFPGFGLVGNIVTEFLIEHLKAEQIGSIFFDEIPAMVAVHESKVVSPIGIYYNQKDNIVIVHGITAVIGIEWKIADVVLKLAKDLGAKEIITIEGVGSTNVTETSRVFYFCSEKKKKELEEAGALPLKEGIVMGVTGALLVKGENVHLNSLFAETHSQLPDSKAAAEIIKVLDKYLGFNLDPKPLLQQAEEFERKLKGIMKKAQEAEETSDKKQLSYVG